MSTPPQVSVAFTAEDRGLSAAIQGLNTQLKSLAATQTGVATTADAAAASEQKLAFSMTEARGSAALLGEETGVKLNRHLRSVLASSSTLGPILQAAFPIAAAIGFAEVIVHAAEKLSTFIADTLIYTEAQKHAYEITVAISKANAEHAAQMAKLNLEYEKFGKSGAARAAIDLREANAELTKAKPNIDAAMAALNAPMPAPGLWDRFLGMFGVDSGKVSEAQAQRALAFTNATNASQEAQVKANLATQKLGEENLKSADVINKAKLAAALEAARDSLAATQAANTAEEAENARNYARGRESLASYWATRRDIIEKGVAAEVTALEAAKKAAQTELTTAGAKPGAEGEAERIAAREKIAHIEAEIAAVRAKGAAEQSKLDDELIAKSEENARTILAFREADLALQGKSAAAEAAKLEQEKKTYEQALLATGMMKEEADAEVAVWERRRTLAAEFTETQKRMQTEMAGFQERQKATPELLETVGPFSPEARANVAAMRNEVTQLRAELEKLRAEAIPGNEQQAKTIEDMTIKIGEMSKAIDAIDPEEKMKKEFGTSVAADISNFFAKGIGSAHSFGAAMKELAASVIQSIQQIIAQLIQMQIQAALMKAITGAMGGGGVPGGGGTTFTPFETGGGSLPLPSGMATGGLVTGPGGPKSDIIPAMLSSGEFVMSAESVAALGTANLEAINKGFATSAVSAPHFASGGFVGGGGGASEISMGIGLDEGLVLRHLSSKAAAKVILSQLANNPKAAQRALQRTD